MAQPVIDIWSGIDHKKPVIDPPAWASDLDKRRLNFYATVRAYVETVARLALRPDPDEDAKEDEWQEFGDVRALVDAVASMILGEEVSVVVEGAGNDPGPAPELPPVPEPPAPGGSEVEQQVLAEAYQAALDAWAIRARERIEEWGEQVAEADGIAARQEWLDGWADVSGFLAALVENESENVVPLGSGVYVFGWDGTRPDVEIYEPGVYFPELSDAKPAEFPDRVHLIWYFEGGDKVRRLTYELLPVEEVPGAPSLRYQSGAEVHCVLTDEWWPQKAFKDPYGPNEGGTVEVDDEGPIFRRPQGLDFIPILHVPHDLARRTHYGRSFLSTLFQLLDEIAAADLDESLASRWAGQPPVAISGMSPGASSIDLTPGSGVRVGDGGGVHPVEMAANLATLLDRVRGLLRRLSVSARVPEGMLGRTDTAEVTSGIQLALSFSGGAQMVRRARLARESKYRLGLKMVQRIAIQNEDPTIDGDVVYPAEVQFGPFLPSDLPGLADMLIGLVAARIISQETAVGMLQEAGAPIEHVRDEVARIRSIMFAEADQLTGAVENPDAAARFLGRPEYRSDRQGIDTEAPVEQAEGAAV